MESMIPTGPKTKVSANYDKAIKKVSSPPGKIDLPANIFFQRSSKVINKVQLDSSFFRHRQREDLRCRSMLRLSSFYL